MIWESIVPDFLWPDSKPRQRIGPTTHWQIRNRTDCRRQLTEELFRYSVIVSSWQGICEETVLNRILEESLLACYGEFTQKGIEPVIDAE